MKHLLLAGLLFGGLISGGGKQGPDGCLVSGPDVEISSPSTTIGQSLHTLTYTVADYKDSDEGRLFLRQQAIDYASRLSENGPYRIVFLDAQTGQALYESRFNIVSDLIGSKDVSY
jgi:hypothetical protein